jgi:hypothetical protein
MRQKQSKRLHFTFYRSFYEAIKTQEPLVQAQLYDAIFELSFNFIRPENLSEKAKSLWLLIEPNLLTSLKNYGNGCKPKRSHPISQVASQNEATPSYSISNSNSCIKKEGNGGKTEKDIYEKYPDFIKFWELYKKGSKKNALNEYLKIKDNFPLDIIINHIKSYFKDNEYKFRKDAERYIKSALWETPTGLTQTSKLRVTEGL